MMQYLPVRMFTFDHVSMFMNTTGSKFGNETNKYFCGSDGYEVRLVGCQEAKTML